MMSFSMWDFETLCFTGRHVAFLQLKWNFCKIQQKLDPITNTSPLPVSGASTNKGYGQTSASYAWSLPRVLRKDRQPLAIILSGSWAVRDPAPQKEEQNQMCGSSQLYAGERRSISSRHNTHLTITTTTTNRIALATSVWAELLFFWCLAGLYLAFKAHFEHLIFLCCLG